MIEFIPRIGAIVGRGDAEWPGQSRAAHIAFSRNLFAR
jgi:hypothetical protein